MVKKRSPKTNAQLRKELEELRKKKKDILEKKKVNDERKKLEREIARAGGTGAKRLLAKKLAKQGGRTAGKYGLKFLKAAGNAVKNRIREEQAAQAREENLKLRKKYGSTGVKRKKKTTKKRTRKKK